MALAILDGPSHETLVEGQAKESLPLTLEIELGEPKGRRKSGGIRCSIFHREIIDFRTQTWGFFGVAYLREPVPPQLFKATFSAVHRKGVFEWFKPEFQKLNDQGLSITSADLLQMYGHMRVDEVFSLRRCCDELGFPKSVRTRVVNVAINAGVTTLVRMAAQSETFWFLKPNLAHMSLDMIKQVLGQFNLCLDMPEARACLEQKNTAQPE